MGVEIMTLPQTYLDSLLQGRVTERGRLSTVDLLIKVACFVKMVNNILCIKNIKSS
jgi:hypothetical protein